MRIPIQSACWFLVVFAAPAAAQQLSLLVDTNPVGNGNAWIWPQTPSHAWLTGGGWLWRTDGTAAGTQAVHAIGASNVGVAEIGDRVFYTSNLNYQDQGLFTLDAAGAATQLLAGAASTESLFELHGEALFRRTTVNGSYPNYYYSTDSWLSDGTVAGTRPAPFIPVDTANPNPPWRLHGDLLITVDDSYFGTLFQTDGRSTTVLTTVPRGIGTGVAFEPIAHSTGRRLFFVKRLPGAFSGQVVLELWQTDGTVVGTLQAYNPAQPGMPSLWALLGCIGDRAYFAGGTSLRELWQTDGTTAGTVFVTMLPGVPSLGFRTHQVDDGIYFAAADVAGAIGVEPVFTDGTATGTAFLGDLTPGPASSDEFVATAIGGKAALLRGNFAGTHSLWLSAGTPATTSRLLNLGAVLTSSWRWAHALTRGHYLMAATDALGDREIWTVDGVAAAQQIGAGTPASAAPRLTATRPTLGATMTIALAGAPPNAAGLLVLGAAPARIALYAGVLPLYVDLGQTTLQATLGIDPAGHWTTSVPVPMDPSLFGVTLALQAAVAAPTSAVGIDVSNGLLATLGN